MVHMAIVLNDGLEGSGTTLEGLDPVHYRAGVRVVIASCVEALVEGRG